MLRILAWTVLGITCRTTYSWVYHTAKFYPQSRIHGGSAIVLGLGQVESWREFVPLGVSALVLIDVAMGRPMVNTIMKTLSSQSGMEDVEGVQSFSNIEDSGRKRKERVDTERIAREALEQAYASRDLRK
jgi:hypothetical protein